MKSIYPVDIQNIFKMFNDKFINFYNLVIVEFLSVNILKEFLLHFERKKIRSYLNFALFLKTLFLSRYKENVLTCFPVDFSLIFRKTKDGFEYEVLKNRKGFIWKRVISL